MAEPREINTPGHHEQFEQHLKSGDMPKAPKSQMGHKEEKRSPNKYCLGEGLGLDSAESDFKDTRLTTLEEMRKTALNEV